jgi:hypothetical protein
MSSTFKTVEKKKKKTITPKIEKKVAKKVVKINYDSDHDNFDLEYDNHVSDEPFESDDYENEDTTNYLHDDVSLEQIEYDRSRR